VTGWGWVQAEKQAVEGNDPHGGHGYVHVCEGNMALFLGEEGEPWGVEIKPLCFNWLCPFLKLV
jgi:hypothetical protein